MNTTHQRPRRNQPASAARTLTRRAFLERGFDAASLLAMPALLPASARAASGSVAPSERVTVGLIGPGLMGSGHLKRLAYDKQFQLVAVCDVDKVRRDNAREVTEAIYAANEPDGGYKGCAAYNDFRELLARKDIDAVHVATPDHWHSIMVVEACRAGKDVYCQKPETRTLREGSLMVEAARRYNRVVSGGSQRVLEDYRKIVDPCWDGTLGTIKSINVSVWPPSVRCNLPAQQMPDDLDWDLWLGPAPWAPFNERRYSGTFGFMEHGGSGWRAWDDYSGGMLTDWGAHHVGGALFAIDVRELQPTDVVYHDEK